ncbi:MAG: hypothetical protein ABSB95_15525 [Dissulfurispiraceae bacterium]|jgi:hypothetical protein
MKKLKFNPIDMIRDYFIELQERFETATDAHEKNVLHMRLRNLQDVMKFLASTQFYGSGESESI